MENGHQNIITGNSKIDFEHDQIFSILQQLEDVNMSQSKRIASCEQLLHYISDHCKSEEDLMSFYEYPEMDSHKEQHRDLQDNFLKKLSNFIKSGGVTGPEIQKLFYNHIVVVDLPMLKFVQIKAKVLPEPIT